MKKVVIKSITLRNFRGEKDRTTYFNCEAETTIAGENGLGKSRHFDAFVWLLFGKDTADRKDYNIRSIENGEPLHRVECSVSATLLIDGAPLTIKRAFTEKWVKPRGQVEEVFKGNETECFWNDVPVSITDYQKRIGEIINDSVFKMVTNPLFFVSMKWQEQREQLFQLAGTITDYEIAAQKPEFAALLDKISGKSFADFKREIAARKKRLKDELAEVQPRIDQTQKLMPHPVDFNELVKQAADLERKIAEKDAALSDKSEAMRQLYEAIREKQASVNDLKQKQQKILFEAQSQARKDAFAATERRKQIIAEITSAGTRIKNIDNEMPRIERVISTIQTRVAEKQQEVAQLRESWYAENAKEYTGSDTCPTCGQPLPEHMKAEARVLFTQLKANKLAEITREGSNTNSDLEHLDRSLAEANKVLENNKKVLIEEQDNLVRLQNELSTTPPVEEPSIIPDEIPEYKVLGDEIKSLEVTIPNVLLINRTDEDELKFQKTTLQHTLQDVQKQLASRELIVKYSQEIEALEKHGKYLAQQIADVECEEYTIAQFTKAKINECERRINGLFKHVTFKLFDYTIDGNEYETCIPLIAGVPFDVANTAGQVNAGLDIINALCRFYGVCAPIFIDGRESVNHIIPTESQIINLVVSSDKDLIIK
jgi:exonuclease SbcC